VRELPGKDCRFHPPGRARALHQGVQRRSADTQHQCDAEHTLVAYESHLEARQIIGWSDQGYEATWPTVYEPAMKPSGRSGGR